MPESNCCEIRGLGKKFDLFDRPRDRVAHWLRAPWAEPKAHWAVRGVSLEVVPGAAVGLIGGNGAGKTTLLRLIAGALTPTEGEVRRRGSVFLVSGYGRGFHRALSGRENVDRLASLLRLPGDYSREHMHEIEEFAGLGEFFDRPVSTYSRGMTARLAFALLSFHRPDVLLLDEALVAGDAEFAAKCETRLAALLSAGVGVVMATHSMAAVSQHCSVAALLHRGALVCTGPPAEVVPRYLQGRREVAL
jgi:lipopolysaccharide transport system ATP-binding protein